MLKEFLTGAFKFLKWLYLTVKKSPRKQGIIIGFFTFPIVFFPMLNIDYEYIIDNIVRIANEITKSDEKNIVSYSIINYNTIYPANNDQFKEVLYGSSRKNGGIKQKTKLENSEKLDKQSKEYRKYGQLFQKTGTNPGDEEAAQPPLDYTAVGNKTKQIQEGMKLTQ